MWNWAYTWQVLPRLLQALQVTVAATFAAFALALVVGLALALGRRSRFRPLVWFISGFVTFVRNTPPLVQLFFLFYVLPTFGLALSPFMAGTLGLGLHYSTYLSEVFRAGIDAVPRGQWEAATALNFTRAQTWRRIILPQAIPPVVPVLGNYLIVLFKETPLLSAITLVEMAQTAKIIGAGSFRYLEPFTLVGVLFLLVSLPAAVFVRRLERRLKRQERSA